MMNRIIHQAIPELDNDVKKVIVYYIDISDEAEIKKFIDEVEKYYTNEAINGNVIDGMKLVAGKKGNRKYTNESDVREALKNAGYTENDFEKKSLMGITDMQRLLGGKVEMENILGAYIVQPDGTPILVPEDDPREKI